MVNHKKIVTKEGSVRVDLVGGTLDLEPIASIIKNTVTINMATGLKAKISLEENYSSDLKIFSADYHREYCYKVSDLVDENFYQHDLISSHFFKEMLFVVMICKHFGVEKGISVTLGSGAPAGSGLGGSSAMGVTLAEALLAYIGKSLPKSQIVQEVRTIEEVILNRGVAGYQDYYPALYGGILAIRPNPSNHLIEQCFSKELANFISSNMTLVYSGQSRNSGINNWEVFKAFFDADSEVKSGLTSIAKVSAKAYEALKSKDYQSFLQCIADEGALREKLFSGIVTPAMKIIDQECIKQFSSYKGLKVCGAGGGGCFLLVGVSGEKVKSLLESHSMQVLSLEVSPPLDHH